MEISRIEFAQRCEFRPRADEELAGPVIGDLGLPQCLQVPINGHQRHSEHLAELGLSEWQRTSVGFHEPGEFGSIELLAKEVRDPRRTVSAARLSTIARADLPPPPGATVRLKISVHSAGHKATRAAG